MKPLVFVTLALFFGAFAARSLGDEKPGAHAKLIGTWKAEWIEVNGQQSEPEGDAAQAIQFKGEEIVLANQTVNYSVDTETDSNLIDIVVKTDDGERTLEGIFKVEGSKFTICVFLSVDGVSNRPDKFETSEGSKRIMIQFARAS